MSTTTDAEHSASARRRARRGNAIVFSTAAAGAACIALSLFLTGASSRPSLVALVLAVALVALSDTVVFHLRYGHENYTLTWSEAAVLVGLVLAPSPWITLAAPLGMII